MKGIKRVAAAVVGLGTASIMIGSGIAQADPSGIPAGGHGYDRPLQGVGSDTTQDVMNGLASVITDSSVAGDHKVLASWNAIGGAFQSRATGCSYASNTSGSNYAAGGSLIRPNGSGAGVNALNDATLGQNGTTAATNGSTGCFDYARASGVQGAKTMGMTYIPFAKDAVAFAIANSSNLPRQLSAADLKAIYTCQYPGFNNAVVTNGVVTTPATYEALLPQAGSGTRKFWVSALGITDPAGQTRSASNACLSDQTDHKSIGGTNIIEEHKGSVLDDNSIVPISIAQYIAQSEGVIADARGEAILGTITDKDSTGGVPASVFSLPMSMNTGYSTAAGGSTSVTLYRDVYNVVPTTVLNGSTAAATLLRNTFVGSSAYVCQQTAVIQKYGFGAASNCGDTVTTTAGQ